jgi:hypothetical protein
MVDGIVIEIIVLSEEAYENRVWINCRDSHDDECAIYVERNADSEQIRVGDTLWWQGRRAYWTTHNRASGEFVCVDQPIPRIGCSGVGRPEGR